MSDQISKAPKQQNRFVRFVTEKFSEHRAEFRKIVWPSKQDLIKHTITTIVISLIFGAFIALLDGAFGLIFTTVVNQFTPAA